MPKSLLTIFAALPLFASAAQLTEMETRWLQAGGAVVAYAKQMQLPIDLIVQPQDAPGAVPLAMGFDGGRCKLVLTMRGNAQAEAVLEGVPRERQALMIEAMTAHEVGHCWRYVQGAWHTAPQGFQEQAPDPSATDKLRQLSRELDDTRREEGYADLAALAWMQRSHPAEYAVVYAWMHQVRAAQPASHVSHDTMNWLALARNSAAFGATGTPFEQARTLWSKGVLAGN